MNDDAQTAVEMLALARARADRAAARSVELYDLLERVRAAQGDTGPAGTATPAPPASRGDMTAQRRVAQLEAMAATAHERAAELYESWLQYHTGAPLTALEHGARRHREIAAVGRSVDRLAERTLTGFEARVEDGASVGLAGSLTALAALDRLRQMVSHRVDETVEACRREGATWENIGSALHVTRQTAHQRYRHRTE